MENKDDKPVLKSLTLKRGTVAYYEAKLAERKARYARGHAKRKKKTSITTLTKKKPEPRYINKSEYDFLKYIRVVFRWALDNNPDLSRARIELLLYLYGVGAFPKKTFLDYHRLIGMYQTKGFNEMMAGGWIKMWRPRKGKQHALYTLTRKAKLLCHSMHAYACGDKEMPNNPLKTGGEAPRINNYYLDIIKKMNSDTRKS